MEIGRVGAGHSHHDHQAMDGWVRSWGWSSVDAVDRGEEHRKMIPGKLLHLRRVRTSSERVSQRHKQGEGLGGVQGKGKRVSRGVVSYVGRLAAPFVGRSAVPL